MATRDRVETLFGKRLRLAMSSQRVKVEELAVDAGLSEAAIEKLRNGKTRQPRKSTVQKIAKALGLDEGYFGQELNGHVFADGKEDLSELEVDYGPSVSSSMTFGPHRTLWLAYDTTGDDRYDPEGAYAVISSKEPNFSKTFIKLRDQIEANNEKLKADPTLGEPYFDGPTFCLSRYRLTHSEDGHEKKGIEVFFSKSRYANNVTAKSTSAINLRKKALREFHHLDQPIEWLASGVGVAVVVFCDDGTHFVTCQRSDTERFRSREFDISVVEGINPVKDRHPEKTDRVYIHDAVKRAVHAELGFEPEDDEINVVGFGVDLEYYQWNFISYVESSLSFQEIELAWQTADEKFETMALSYVSATPEDAAEFAAANPVWSSGLAALYTSLFKRSPVPQKVRSAFIGAFEKKYS